MALQVKNELSWFLASSNAKIVSCVGGMDIRTERRNLETKPNIVVGTPGRLKDHIERGYFNVSNIKTVVLDEADEMLDMGFREDLEAILDTTPDDKQTLMFSATIPPENIIRSRNLSFFPTEIIFSHFAEVLKPNHISNLYEVMVEILQFLKMLVKN